MRRKKSLKTKNARRKGESAMKAKTHHEHTPVNSIFRIWVDTKPECLQATLLRRTELQEHYDAWLRDNVYPPTSSVAVGRAMRAVFPRTRTFQKLCGEDGVRHRYYHNGTGEPFVTPDFDDLL